MPISSDPNDIFTRKLNDADAATFHLRFITAKETRRVTKLIIEASGCTQDEQAESLLDEAIAVGLVRHEGVTLRGKAVPADAKPSDFLSIPELFQLANLTHTAPVDEELSRKKQSASAPASA